MGGGHKGLVPQDRLVQNQRYEEKMASAHQQKGLASQEMGFGGKWITNSSCWKMGHYGCAHLPVLGTATSTLSTSTDATLNEATAAPSMVVLHICWPFQCQIVIWMSLEEVDKHGKLQAMLPTPFQAPSGECSKSSPVLGYHEVDAEWDAGCTWHSQASLQTPGYEPAKATCC
ncbi:hypothetical protein WISP_30901 [Willisornis vidua]|uniref:Uncharacterized protein n=1 Tax=Willisornis vidua TaxID=1566151 RepID=A0ABQ9DN59_9PASS|nr:hypothetical protein WISP_30901 [Willisornis vidua]